MKINPATKTAQDKNWAVYRARATEKALNG